MLVPDKPIPLGSPLVAGAGAGTTLVAVPVVPILAETVVEDEVVLPAPLLSFADAVGSVGDGEDTGEDVDVRLERCEFAVWLLLEEAGF